MRYPTVEAATALLFLGLGVMELLARGMNLPARPMAMTDGLAYPPLGLGELGGLLAYHLLLVSTLLAAAMIAYDGHRLPWRLLLPAVLVGGLAPSLGRTCDQCRRGSGLKAGWPGSRTARRERPWAFSVG